MALGKQPLYRVPDKKHSAKSGTLGKEAVSGSEVRSLGLGGGDTTEKEQNI